MNGTVKAPEINREIAQWMRQLENHIASLRASLASVVGRPRLDRLVKLQKAGQQHLDKLIAVYWAQEKSSRAVLLQAYLSALLTLKFFCDDLYIEAAEEAYGPKEDADSSSADRLKKIEEQYQTTIEAWIVGSPLINPDIREKSGTFLPRIGNAINMPYIRALDFRTAPTSTPPTVARAAANMEIQR